MTAFLELAGKHGYAETTTRAIAQAAGVNEVTVFRQFKDKDSLARTAVERFHPGAAITGYTLDFGVGAKAEAMEGVLNVLRFLRDTLWERAAFFRFNITEGFRRREIASLMADAPELARDLIRRALERAKPRLRSEVDVPTTALMLQGLIAMPMIFRVSGVGETTLAESDRMLAASLRPLFREETA